MKDRKGNLTDVYLPPGILPPVGWYPGDPPIFTEEETAMKGALSRDAAEDGAAQ